VLSFATAEVSLKHEYGIAPIPTVLRYGHDGVKWPSDWRVIVEHDASTAGGPSVENLSRRLRIFNRYSSR
jgi:hypothetical protein